MIKEKHIVKWSLYLMAQLLFCSCSCEPQNEEVVHGNLKGLVVGESVINQLGLIMSIKDGVVESKFSTVSSCEIGPLQGTMDLRLLKDGVGYHVDVKNGIVDNISRECLFGVCNGDVFDGSKYCDDSVDIVMDRWDYISDDTLFLLKSLEGEKDLFFYNQHNDRYSLITIDAVVVKIKFEEYGGCPGGVY